MAELYLHVPLYAQQKDMTCWFASARMVKCYKKIEQVTGLPDYYANNWGLQGGEVARLAEVEGFKYLPNDRPKFSVASLIHTLGRYGPIWVNATTNGGGQHAIVLTGASDANGWGEAMFNDPGPVGEGSFDSMPLETLNARLGAQLLYYPPNM